MNALDLLYIPVAAAYAPKLLAKKRGGWAERFGRLAPLPAPGEGRRRVLVHGVSVGEVNALRTLVPLLAERHDVVVSATTDTGLARAHALYKEPVHVVRYPLDLSGAVRRFLDAAKPDAGVVPQTDDGGSCAVALPGRSSGAAVGAALALGLALMAIRRRRS